MTEVWTAARNIERGQRITDGLVRRERVELRRQRRNAIEDVDQLRGKRAKRSIRAGQVLTATMLEGIPVVKRGDPVIIIAQSGSLLIRAIGKALQAGGVGETVQVENTSTRRRVHAQVIDSRTVRVVF